MDKLSIGELAKKANVNKETLRYYERKGLIPEPPRNDSGHRQYSEIEVKRTGFIKKTLNKLAGRCSGQGPVSECPILDELEEN